MIAQEVIEKIRRFDLVGLIEWAQDWTQTASHGEISAFLDSLPLRERRHLRELLRDVVSGYPNCLYGVPVLCRYDNPGGACLSLPLPDYTPDPEVTGMSWLSLDCLRQPTPLRQPTGDHLVLLPGNLSCAVLMISTRSYELPDISRWWADNVWWGDLWRGELEVEPRASLKMSARLLLPLAEALEAGYTLLSAAQTGQAVTDVPQHFLTPHAWTWALDAGLHWWRESPTAAL